MNLYKDKSNTEKAFIAIRIFAGIVLFWASINKIYDPEGFAQVIYNYKLIPPVLGNILALVLPWVEAICGILLITGRLVKGSLFIYNFLMIIFIIAISISAVRGVDINCGCFTVASSAKSDLYIAVIRDIFFLVPGIWALYYKIHLDEDYISNQNLRNLRL